MNNIRKLTEIAEKNRGIRGSNQKEETSQSYIIEIPQNHDFEGYCLILCIVLGMMIILCGGTIEQLTFILSEFRAALAVTNPGRNSRQPHTEQL